MPLSRLLWRVRTMGRRFHRGEGGLIVAANHSSWLDAYLVQYAVFPTQLTFLMSEVFYDLPILGLVLPRRACPTHSRQGSEGRPSVAAMKRGARRHSGTKRSDLPLPRGRSSPTTER